MRRLSVLLSMLAACAQAPVTPTIQAQSSPPPAAPAAEVKASGRTIQNKELGYRVELPLDSPLLPARDRGLIAAAPDGTKASVFFEHLSSTASVDACWTRLFERVGTDVPNPPHAAAELRAMGQAGFVRGARRVYLAAYPRQEACLVLAVDGPKDSEVLSKAAPMLLTTFQPTDPSPEFAARLALEAGSQLLERKEYGPALRQFEAALKGDDSLQTRGHFGAGLAAYFLGPEQAALAAEHLSKVVASRADPERSPEDEVRQEEYRDALMYLGLAYASLKQFPHATSTIAELVERFPDDAIARYNFACVLALGGNSDAALDELRSALKRDPELTDHARQDDDLKSLRTLTEWRLLIGDTATPPGASAP